MEPIPSCKKVKNLPKGKPIVSITTALLNTEKEIKEK